MTPLVTWPRFLTPDRLWLLVVPLLLLAVYIVLLRRKSKQGMRYTNTSILDIIVPAQSQWLRHITVGLVLLSLACLSFAWARPLGTDKVPRERATVVMILDVSKSMDATDIEPNRLEAAKQEASAFIDGLPEGFNLALVEMSGNSGLILPPTTDHEAVRRAILAATTQESTDVAGALRAAIEAIAMAPKGDEGEAVPAVVVMLSDASGTTAPTSPKQAAGDLKAMGVPIYSIVFGTDYGYVTLPDPANNGEPTRYNVAPDHDFFKDLAEITDGKTYDADNAAQASEAYEAIHSQVGYVDADKEVTASMAGFAALFAAVAAVGAVMLGAKWR
ncbi:MAG: VWA domain-containing protein [Propionibacteriaceae bacterium]|jgi:Ca-activated chloride channel family protein|nr:VWA domain-containing protein [Propionibacteriaceae bacterium]